MAERMTRTELNVVARSFGATRQLSPDDIRRVLAETIALADDLERMRALVTRLAAPWSLVRASMTALYRASAVRDPAMRERLRALSVPWCELRQAVEDLVGS